MADTQHVSCASIARLLPGLHLQAKLLDEQRRTREGEAIAKKIAAVESLVLGTRAENTQDILAIIVVAASLLRQHSGNSDTFGMLDAIAEGLCSASRALAINNGLSVNHFALQRCADAGAVNVSVARMVDVSETWPQTFNWLTRKS